MQDKEPWIKAKDLNGEDSARAVVSQKEINNCLHICLQLTANLAILIHPFLPFTAKNMLHMMKVVDKILDWENAGSTRLLSKGYSLREPRLLFRKIEDTEIEAQVNKLRSASTPPQTEDAQNKEVKLSDQLKPASSGSIEEKASKAQIQYEDFAKLDLKVGTIVQAEKVEKADKLLKLEIDMGTERRTIVSGIAQHFSPVEILGRQVVVVANLAPRKMRGIESNGMILMAEDKSGKLHFVSPSSRIDEGSGVS